MLVWAGLLFFGECDAILLAGDDMPRIKQPMSRKYRVLLGFVGIAVIVAAYSVLSNIQKNRNPSDTTLPNVSQFQKGLTEIVKPRKSELEILLNPDAPAKPPWIVVDLWATYSRLFKALVWASGISMVLGILMGCFSTIESFFNWSLSFLSKIPPTAMLAVFLVIGVILKWEQGTMFIVLVGFGITPTLTQSIYLAAKHDLHKDEIDKAYTLGASNIEVVWNVVLRKILPKIIDGIRLTIGPAMVYLIAAEYSLGHEGFGYRIRMQGRMLNMNVVYIYLMILGSTGLLMGQSMIYLRKFVCPWYGKGK